MRPESYRPETLRGVIRSTGEKNAMLRSPAHKLYALIGLALIARVLFTAAFDTFYDDAYIIYRYAHNLASGYGMVFNKGEHVLGTSAPLYTMVIAAVETVTSSGFVPFFGRWSGTACLICSVVLLWKYLPLSEAGRIICATLLLVYGRIFQSSLWGMEDCWIILLMVLSLVALMRRSALGIGITSGLLFILKIDTVAWSVPVFLMVWRYHRPLLLRSVLIGCCIALPWAVYATYYYGSFIPHTVEAKQVAYSQYYHFSVLNAVLAFIPDQVRSNALYIVLFTVLIYGTLAYSSLIIAKSKNPDLLVLPLYCLGYVALLFLSRTPVGGWTRWIVPLWAMIIVLAAFVADRLLVKLEGRIRKPVLPAAGWLSLAAVPLLLGPLFLYHSHKFIPSGPFREVGEWVQTHADTNNSIMLEPIGLVGYMTGLYVHDYVGLVSADVTQRRRIRSNRWFTVYLKEKAPTFLVLRDEEFTSNQLLHAEYGDGFLDGPDTAWFNDTYERMFVTTPDQEECFAVYRLRKRS
jgi:hypothetical protein